MANSKKGTELKLNPNVLKDFFDNKKEGEKVSVEEICRVVESAYNVENNNCTMIDYSNELARKSNELKAADNFLYPMFDIALAVIVLNIMKKQGGSDEDKEKMNVLISSSMKKLFSGE
tara:strand:- start:403 stop:756 length:354 start_codon:yes stop_codon:yes gene_type:complete